MAEIGKKNSEDFLPEDIFAEVDAEYNSNVVRKQDSNYTLPASAEVSTNHQKREKIDNGINKNKTNKKLILFVLFFVILLSFVFIAAKVFIDINKNTPKKDVPASSSDSKNTVTDQEDSPSIVIKDSDNDNLYDVEEVKFSTDPNRSDTDEDKILDGDEVKTYKTNPLSSDTDGDGISDYDEVFVYKTNPLSSDTDGDGYRDMDEINNGYNPNGDGKMIQN